MAKKKSKNKREKNKITIKNNSTKKIVNNKFKKHFGLSIILLLGVIIYSNSLDCSFQFDDISSIVKNSRIQDVTDIDAIKSHSKSRFIPYLSIAANYHFGELNVRGYHIFNILIHLLNTCLVYWLTLLLLALPNLKGIIENKDHKLLALITATLFVSHPLATQSVTYIVQRLASMAALFYLLSICMYLKARLSQKGSSTAKLYFSGFLLAAILALLCKENTYTLPLAIVLVEIFFFPIRKIPLNFKDPRILLSIAAITLFLWMLFSRISLSIFNPIPPEFGSTYTVTPLSYLYTQFGVILNYIQLLIIPVGLNVDHDVTMVTSLWEIKTIASLLVNMAIIALGVFLFKRHKLYSFGIFWFYLTISVESSFIPLTDLMFEHRTYLPSFGFFLIITMAIYQFAWRKNKTIAMGLLVLMIGTNSILTYQRNKDWKTVYTLWTDSISKSPNKARPYATRGDFYRDIGKRKEAIADYDKAISLNPKYAIALQNRGYMYDQMGQWDKAIVYYTRAIDVDPNYKIALYNRGIAYFQLNQFPKALDDFTKAIELKYIDYKIHFLRGMSLSNLQQWDRAIQDYDKSLSLNPNFKEASEKKKIAIQYRDR